LRARRIASTLFLVGTMQRCVGCRRHVAVHEHECPFCHAKLGLVSSTTAALVVAIAVMTSACSDRAVANGEDAGDESTSASTDDTNATMSTSAPTTSATSSTVTTTTDAPTTTFDTSEDTSTTSIDTDPGSAGFIYGSAEESGDILLECDVWAQDCPDGEKCVPWANDGGATLNATRCSPVGPNEVGEPCAVEGSSVSGVDDCELGAVCFDVDPETLEGTCVAQCTGSEASPQCGGDLSCFVVGGFVNLCLSTCSPLVPTCEMDDVCAPWNDAFYCLPDGSGDGGQYGDECLGGINTCDPGLFCAFADDVPQCAGEMCCTEFCDVTVEDPNAQCSGAADGQQCVSWWNEGELPPGYENVGACVVPR
jgi:hypothetical protein